jgi:formamidopyrimidine-DNA glycosylase
MPELPEVETIVCGLREKLRDLEFSKVEVRLKKCIRGSKKSLLASLKGKKILRVERRGKNIIFHLSGGAALLVHLRMTGRLRFMPAPTPPEKHTHVIFSFKNHPDQLRFVDQRQFGRLFMEKKQAGDILGSLADLGPEPFEISAKEFIRRARAKHRAIKPLLLDQRFLAGVGNIYADEALYRAQIHPHRRGNALPEKTLLRLYDALVRILREAIRAGGTSVRTYVDASGSPGGFQRFLRVYSREGKACPSCGAPIVRERVAGRSSFFCPRCQPRPRREWGRSVNPRQGRSPAGKSVA